MRKDADPKLVAYVMNHHLRCRADRKRLGIPEPELFPAPRNMKPDLIIFDDVAAVVQIQEGDD